MPFSDHSFSFLRKHKRKKAIKVDVNLLYSNDLSKKMIMMLSINVLNKVMILFPLLVLAVANIAFACIMM